VSKIVHHHLKLNIWTVLLRLYNPVAEVIYRWTSCEYWR